MIDSLKARWRQFTGEKMPDDIAELPLPSPKRVPVRLLARRSGTVKWQELDESFDAHDIEIKHDGYKFYFEEQQ